MKDGDKDLMDPQFIKAATGLKEGGYGPGPLTGTPGSLAGQFLIAREKTTEDRLMEIALEAGAEDVIASEHGFEVRCDIHAFDKISHALEHAGLKPDSAELAYIPTTTVPVADRHVAATLAKLHETLEENDDVQQVFSNEEIDPAIAGE